MLKGKKVELNPLGKSDLANLLKWFNDMKVTQYLSMYLPMTEQGEEKWLERINTTSQNTDIVFSINAFDGEKTIPIGTCGLHKIDWKNRDAEFGIAIGEKEYWSNGYGTEAAELIIAYAFSQLNLHRISSAAYGFNERSIKMHLKIGFVQEGIVREAIYKNGQYQDKVLFGLLKKEWEKHKK